MKQSLATAVAIRGTIGDVLELLWELVASEEPF